MRVPPGQQRLEDSARQHMHKLAGMYGKAGVILNGRSLDPLVDAPTLEAQWERFCTIMTSWGSRLNSQQSITTAQAWQEASTNILIFSLHQYTMIFDSQHALPMLP